MADENAERIFDKLADWFDSIYRDHKGKDYRAEAVGVVDLVLARKPGAASLLDVGSGTGEHLTHYAKAFTTVEGLDLSSRMREETRAKLPDVVVHDEDMRDFDLGRTYDTVVCMWGTFALMRSVEELDMLVGCMARHLSPGGVLFAEPWWFPEQYLDGYIGAEIVRDGDRVMSRVSRTTLPGRSAEMEIHFVVAGPDGVEHFTQTHVYTPFSRNEVLGSFRRAGCADVEYVTAEPFANGYFIGTRE
ncbi:SAM-dependent methyltransferase [Saccharothrix ecbatanensis]|uniref:SAM-dependent methyltransferase n=1 Tax=Saccharothrix ecbatanensis TaxID=1105145 RepID=A0A7W9HIG5_9PSEU|nr:class I SAM-dependent methyltransferase [Saccharothrix ecbatanensis]MBB5802449.1 SAM-dependent methyltransferase [Saccharothrix ecbatanensis]